jgi:hypothetical protein
MLIHRGSMSAAEIVARAHLAVGGSQAAFGELLGASRRTVTRWIGKESTPSETQVVEMARLVYPRDAELAARIAEQVGATLESLGIVVPPPPPPVVEPLVVEQAPLVPCGPPAKTLGAAQLIDGIVCAAAEAMDLSPRALRPALLAAFKKALELGVTLEEAEGALSSSPGSS